MPRRYGYRPSQFVLGAHVRSRNPTLMQIQIEGVLCNGPDKLSDYTNLLPGEPDQNVWQIKWDGSPYPPNRWYPESTLELLDALQP